jgi:hypothetical protein
MYDWIKQRLGIESAPNAVPALAGHSGDQSEDAGFVVRDRRACG